MKQYKKNISSKYISNTMCYCPNVPSESESEEYDNENNSIIRGKWMMDGAATLEEAIVKLNNFIRYSPPSR